MISLRERKPEQQQAPPIEAPPQTDRQTLLAKAATESPETRKQTLEPPGTVSRDTGNGATAEPADPYKVTRGQVTFDAEGEETATRTSRDLEVPSDSSGVTIGRGYDMKERDADEIFRDMINAGVSEAVANKLKKASGLSGDTARAFIARAEVQHVGDAGLTCRVGNIRSPADVTAGVDVLEVSQGAALGEAGIEISSHLFNLGLDWQAGLIIEPVLA